MQSLQAKIAQFIFGSAIDRQIEYREITLAQRQLQVNGVCDFLAASDGGFKPLKVAVHLFRRAQVKLVAFHLHPRLVGAEFTHVDAQHHVLSFGVLAVDVVAVAGCNKRQAHVVGDFDGAFELWFLDVNIVVHNLDEVAITEQFMEPSRNVLGLVERFFGAATTAQDRSAELAGHATAQTNDAFVMSLKQVLVDPRLVVKTFQACVRGHFDEVFKAGLVLAQQR